MDKPHIFWILIDSARNYETDEDDRGLPKSVSNFAKEAVYFKNVVTSAPSTIQSISSMMTSTPSCLLARSYNNFRSIYDSFDYFPHILMKNGYKVYGAIYFKHGREIMSNVFGIIEKKFFPKNLNHRKEVWTNNDVYDLFHNILDKNNWQEPTMCYLHYNVRVDSNISEIVDNTLGRIKELGLMDNSIIVINSDHGYPSVSRGWNANEAKKEGWGHDQLLYNDNILTPLVLKYPGCKPKTFDDFISTLDIAPTLCHLLGIKGSPKFMGTNVFEPNVNLRENLIRTDNRYIGQLPANISFIKDKKKCILYKDSNDNNTYEYFDLEKDPEEKKSMDYHGVFQDLKDSIEKNIKEVEDFHVHFLYEKWNNKLNGPVFQKAENLCIVLESTPSFRQVIEKVFSKLFPKKEIYFSCDKHLKTKPSKLFDIVIVIIDSEIPWDFGKTNNAASKIKGKKIIFVDNNGKVFKNNVKMELYYDFIKTRTRLFKIDKLFLFDLLYRVTFKKLLKPVQ